MKGRTLLLVAVLLLVFGTILIWRITPETATSPTKVTAVAPSLPPQLVQQAEPEVAPTDPVTNNSPLPSLEGPAALAAAIDKLPLENLSELRDSMEVFIATYPKEATAYALRKSWEHPDPRELATISGEGVRMLACANSVAYALAKTDRAALAEYLAALPANVRPLAAYAATDRYADEGDLQSALASLTPESEQFTYRRVAELYAEKDPQGAAAWVQQLQGKPAYELSLMEMIRVFAQKDAALARRWVGLMPSGSNKQLLLAELDSAPAAPTGPKVDHP